MQPRHFRWPRMIKLGSWGPTFFWRTPTYAYTVRTTATKFCMVKGNINFWDPCWYHLTQSNQILRDNPTRGADGFWDRPRLFDPRDWGPMGAVFRLDALALSVIATATWLAGWVAGWLAVCHSRYCIKTTKPIRKLFGPSGRRIIYAFRTPYADTKFHGEPLHPGR